VRLRNVLFFLALSVAFSACLCAAQPFSYSLTYTGDDADGHVFTTRYKVHPATQNNQAAIDIFSTLEAQNTRQENHCVLDAAQNHLLSVHQITQSREQKAYFEWDISVSSSNANGVYRDLRSGKIRRKTFSIDANAYPIQGIFYLLPLMDLEVGAEKRANLIVPPFTVTEIYFRVVGVEPVEIDSRRYDCLKGEFGLTGILGVITPKSAFWLTQSSPHIPVKYEEGPTTFYLKESSI
jgi:hypothetical protein